MRLQYITTANTAWLYPASDIQKALATTTHPYTFDGTNIVCPTMDALKGVYYDIFAQTELSQPIGNTGFTLGAGTYLEDQGKTLRFQLPGGKIVVVWQLVRQITSQVVGSIPVPGNSPNGTIGYVTTFVSFGHGPTGGYANGLDDVMVIRTG